MLFKKTSELSRPISGNNGSLLVENVNSHYGMIQVLRDVSLRVPSKKLVSIVGANGAGKSTLLRAITGLIPISSGRIIFGGSDISGFRAQDIVKMGISQVLEGRQVFTKLTTYENLELGTYTRRGKDKRQKIQDDLAFVYQLFPRLKERFGQLAGTLSGGEQQMLAIARALMGQPRLMLLDEPSLGLAPLVVKEIFKILTKLRVEGVTIMLVEQRARLALEISDYAYVLELGKIVLEDKADDLMENKGIRQAYLGE